MTTTVIVVAHNARVRVDSCDVDERDHRVTGRHIDLVEKKTQREFGVTPLRVVQEIREIADDVELGDLLADVKGD